MLTPFNPQKACNILSALLECDYIWLEIATMTGHRPMHDTRRQLSAYTEHKK